MNTTVERVALVLLPAALVVLAAVGLWDATCAQTLFVHTTYTFLMAALLGWVGVHVHAARQVRRETVIAWVKDNWPGLVVASAVTIIVCLAVHPGLWILSDEANLVGTSKNLFASQSPTFTVSGKNYFDSYWDIDVAIDQRPPLFPFLVSLLHVVRGYSYTNAFLLNAMILPAFVLIAYRLAKSVGGEAFGIVAGLLVTAHPMTLIAARSGGFDFLALFFALLVVKSFFDHVRHPSPARLAMLWMNLCLFAEIRYESALFIPLVVALLLLLRLVTWSDLRPYAFLYALTPAYLLPRLWQAVFRGSVPEQEPGTITFSLQNFRDNAYEYFKPILSPFHSYPSHAGLVIGFGLVTCLVWLYSHRGGWRSPDWKAPRVRLFAFVVGWMILQVVILFAYVWGRAQSPIAARLVIPIDTFFSFLAAWGLTGSLRRFPPSVAVLLAVAVLPAQVSSAAQHRMLNRLTQTRECATTWRFFDSLHEKRILIVTDRPNLYTIMDYGAMSFESAQRDPMIFEALARRLFYDVYVVQPIALSTKQPLPGYDIWPTRRLETMLEFQNDADVLIRISRVAR